MDDWLRLRDEFAFLGRALAGSGGFAPRVVTAEGGGARVLGPSELVRYPRESPAKFAARNALLVYENHLRSACDRFVSFLGRRRPSRQGADGPLTQLLVQDADLRGLDLDAFWRQFAMQASARGSLLLVIDRRQDPEGSVRSLADQQRQRAVPYLRMALPEDVVRFTLDAETARFESITLASSESIEGRLQDVERDYDTQGWRIRVRSDADSKGGAARPGRGRPAGAAPGSSGWRTVAEGQHGMGACPVLAFTEDGSAFPAVGRFAQIAHLSRRLMNVRSERDEILRSQTFSLLTMQVPPEHAALLNTADVAQMISTHSILTHTGSTPAFIAPDPGPAATYLAVILELEQAIARVAMDDAVQVSSQVESGAARRMRFDALNASLARFASNLQALEERMWSLFHGALGLPENRVKVSWPSDYTLADVGAELEILAQMQATGYPEPVLHAKRRAVAAMEFDNAGQGVLDDALNALDEAARERLPPGGESTDDGGNDSRD